jgi:hypothetical protein
MKELIAKETLLTFPDFQKNVKYILMPANYNLELVSPKTVNQKTTVSPNKIYYYRTRIVINCRNIKGIQKHPTAGPENKSPY